MPTLGALFDVVNWHNLHAIYGTSTRVGDIGFLAGAEPVADVFFCLSLLQRHGFHTAVEKESDGDDLPVARSVVRSLRVKPKEAKKEKLTL